MDENNEKEPHGSTDDEEKEVVVTYTKRKDTGRAKIFRKRISRLGKMARLFVSYKIKNLLISAPKKSKPSANQAPPIFNSVPNYYKKKIVSRAKNCQYCSESDSDCDEGKQTYSNVPRRAPEGAMYRHRRPLALVHQAMMRPPISVNNWGPPPPPRAPPPPRRQPPLLLPPHPPYGFPNPYGYNLMPRPHLYGYQNPYNYNFINGMDVPRPMYPYYYGQKPRDPPVGNSFIHFLSDENTASSCSIM
uniref:uncharacterized protein LOC105350093 n=1 Tax=Fragaria vesca subsp. vesca TaxID=101020 RepID=UPI0005C81C9A|nr:PREDICTED: uncharacterized protein LOC105350093 [Fragaria vesca subsp. vesca]